MTKDKLSQDDALPAGGRLRARHKSDGRELRHEAITAGREDYFQALVAAIAVIAHADGQLDLAERRKLVEAFFASPAMGGFSVAELAEELAEHARAYSYDPQFAERQALASLKTSTLSITERQSICDACHEVIIADGLVHPVEVGALQRIELALGIEGGGR